jgi:hypothetical protein
LQFGHSIKLRGFGTFYVKTKVKVVNTLEEVTADTVERIGIGFLQDDEAKDLISLIIYDDILRETMSYNTLNYSRKYSKYDYKLYKR